MRLYALLSVVLAHALLVIPSLVSHNVVHEKRQGPLDSSHLAHADGSAIITLKIGLKQNSLEAGEQHLYEISHPDSLRYGQHWTSQQVGDMFAPSNISRTVVMDWLRTNGVRDVSFRNGWVTTDLPVHEVENLLQTMCYEYPVSDSEDGSVQISCDEYRLPQHVSTHVDYILPGVASSLVPAKRSACTKRGNRDHETGSSIHRPLNQDTSHPHIKTNLEQCENYTTPACLRALYQLPEPEEVARNFSTNSTAATVGVFEALSYYNQTDLDSLFSQYAPYVPAGTHPILKSVENASVHEDAPLSQRVESNIDVNILYSLLYPKTLNLYQVSGKPGAQNATENTELAVGMDNFLDALDDSFCTETDKDIGLDCGTVSPSMVTSISYDSGELFLTEKQRRRQCYEFMKLALQGHTFVASSGDWGVAGQWYNSTDGVLTNGCGVAGNATATLNHFSNGTIFSPQFPANCPYVLAVGSSMIPQNATLYEGEVAMHQPQEVAAYLIEQGLEDLYSTTTSSAGGFSNYFSRPGYQDCALATYFSQYEPQYASYSIRGIDSNNAASCIGADGGLYNRAGRGIPDVSANAANFPVFAGGLDGPVWGTSLSAPVWASIITLINEGRSSLGKGPVGFVQPVLYEHPEVFQDITEGNNPGCGTEGFSAVPGWDPITGLGIPNFPKLLELFMSLP